MNVIQTFEERYPNLKKKIDSLLNEKQISQAQHKHFIDFIRSKQQKVGDKRLYKITRGVEILCLFLSEYRKRQNIDDDFIKIFQEKETGEPILSEFFSYMNNQNWTNETINSYTSYVRQFFNWLFENKPKYINQQLKNLPGKEFEDEKILTSDDILKIVSSAKSLRDKAMISLHYETGCRPGELESMNVQNYSYDKENGVHWIKIPKTKTFGRPFPIKESVSYLKQHLNTHPLKNDKSFLQAPLWVTTQGHQGIQRLGHRSYIELLRDAVRISRVKGKYENPYWLRHSGVYRNKQRFKSWPVFCRLHGWTENSKDARRYLHTDKSDIENEFLVSQGKRKQEDLKLNVVECPVCNQPNSKDELYCVECGVPMDTKPGDFVEKSKEMENRLKQMENTMNLLKEALGDPEALLKLSKASNLAKSKAN